MRRCAAEVVNTKARGEARIIMRDEPPQQTYRTLIPLFDELRGERELVRPYRLEDAEALRAAVDESREHVRPWLPFADAHQSVEESHDWIAHTMADWLLRENFSMSIWERASGRYLGGIGLHPRDWTIRSFEIGYWLRASAEGHGYITEAAQLVVDFAARELQANRLEIRCNARNARSAAAAERLGFIREAELRNNMRAPDGSLRTTLVYGLIPADPAWPSLRAN
jgi:RimJ/RimL family protein N-acetyltransferase